MDSKLYKDTLTNPPNEDFFSDKEVVYVSDSNSNYNGQIKIDSSSLAGSELWNAYSEAWVEIPYTITIKSSVDSTAGGVMNSFMVGLKNGGYSVIHNLSGKWMQRSVIDQQPFLNMYVGYKVMTTWSLNDVERHGALCLVAPDSAGSQYFSLGASRNGDGSSNNLVALPDNGGQHIWRLGTTANGALVPFNSGFLKRLQYTCFPVSTNDQGYGGNTTINTAARCEALGKNYYTDDSGIAAARVYQWNMMITIRLKDICDFFDKMPLTKGGWVDLTINYNAVTASFTTAAAPNVTMVHTANPTMRGSGESCPIMVASSNLNNPSDGLLNGTHTVTCGVGTGSSVTNAFGSPLISQVRLYVPSYKLKAAREEALLGIARVKRFTYCDIYNYVKYNVPAGGNLNQLLNNSVVNAKSVIVIPQLNNAAGNNATIVLNPIQSLFDSAPATTAPMGAIDNFNVFYAGHPVFSTNFEYDFEAFRNEIESVNCIDGGGTVGCANGLLGYFEWDNSYRYYVADLSRLSDMSRGMNKAIELRGQNGTGKIMDYYTFIEHEIEVELDILSGKIRKISG